MKRMLAIVLTVLMTLSLCPAFAEAVEAPDEAAALEFSHKVYEACQLDALFSRHESVAFTFTNPLDPSRDGFVWETAECAYQEWGLNTAAFDRDRVVYQMTNDEETGEVNVFAGVNYEPEYNPFYCFAGGTEEEFFDAEHDHVVELYEADGLIHSASQFDETLSRQYIEEKLGLEYTGQYIRTEIVLDAETYDVLENREILVQDSEETVVYMATAAYDTPEPVASRTLRAGFERASGNLMTVTFVVDAGTDHEFSRELTVPVNTEAGQMFGDTPVVYFNDADCETLSHWDRMSDRTIYVFTNPDDALIGKFQALLDEVLAAMQPAEADAELAEPDAGTFEALIAANDAREILARHASFEATRVTFRDGEAVQTETNYRDADTYFWDFGDGQATLYLDDLCVARKTVDQGFMYVETICDTEEAVRDLLGYALDSAVVFLPEEETLLETVDADDGQFVAVTQINDPDCVAQQLTETAYASGYEYAEGMIMRFQYTFDIQTTDLLEFEMTLIDTEGEAHLLQRNSVAYDVQDYDPFAEGEPFAEYEAAAKDPEQSRTITVVFDPDTENERGVEYVLPQNAGLSIFLNGEYVKQPYIDRECTQPFEGSDGVSDLMLYVK